MNIIQTIKNETNDHKKKIAVIDGDWQVSYEQLFALVDNAATELKACGIEPMHRVALLCDDSIDYIIVNLAVLSLQAAIVPISPSLSGDEVDAVIERVDVNFLLFEKGVYSAKNKHQVLSGICCKKFFFLYCRVAQDNLPPDYYTMNPAFIRFSSGTTGASKGVIISHESILERTDAADKALKITADDVVLWVLSMSFHFVVTILLFLRRAAAIVLCGGTFPGSFYNGLKRYKGTFIYASPFHYHMLISSDQFSSDLLSNVRIAISTAMRLPVVSAHNFYKKFGFELTEAYGIIEVGLPFINCSKDPMKRGSVGKILPDYKLKIANADTERVGEIHVKGKGMFDAYFSPWESRHKALWDGWFNTGDLGRLDKDGFLFLVGREKNVINFAGMKIFPYHVESVLNGHPAIKESLVYGITHAQYGELPCADIVLKNQMANIDTNEIRRFCYQYLASYKVPKEIHCVPILNRTASGKLKRW